MEAVTVVVFSFTLFPFGTLIHSLRSTKPPLLCRFDCIEALYGLGILDRLVSSIPSAVFYRPPSSKDSRTAHVNIIGQALLLISFRFPLIPLFVDCFHQFMDEPMTMMTRFRARRSDHRFPLIPLFAECSNKYGPTDDTMLTRFRVRRFDHALGGPDHLAYVFPQSPLMNRLHSLSLIYTNLSHRFFIESSNIISITYGPTDDRMMTRVSTFQRQLSSWSFQLDLEEN
ncbi:hypothetical protein F5880DRAFT_501835 [Lentinula raphanica]|nr:hypothetical protein F5880DRAFT_501835 [Lentinula raphanica]